MKESYHTIKDFKLDQTKVKICIKNITQIRLKIQFWQKEIKKIKISKKLLTWYLKRVILSELSWESEEKYTLIFENYILRSLKIQKIKNL